MLYVLTNALFSFEFVIQPGYSFGGSYGMEETNIETRLLQARSAVCLANLKALIDFCDHVDIEKQGVDTCTKAIKTVDRW